LIKISASCRLECPEAWTNPPRMICMLEIIASLP